MSVPSSPLPPSHEALVALSAALGARSVAAVDAALRTAAATASAAEVEETLLQSYLFVGYPIALNAFSAWREISGAPAPAPSADAASWAERGAAVCSTVYGGQYERLRANVRSLHPDMERWMVHEGYGKVLGRAGLDLRMRELCIVALLAALDVPKQLYSHLRGALHAGASPPEVERALELAAAVSGPGVGERAAETWESVTTRSSSDG
ncbi:MAG: carboxymuconolactone decarboxylase family protein [Gemmatimonadetes bacterium]|nr:carboxymuconolactone decarboxylase family protein [Gemmatimonadota bacterium]